MHPVKENFITEKEKVFVLILLTLHADSVAPEVSFELNSVSMKIERYKIEHKQKH